MAELKLKYVLKQHGLSQRGFAESVGIGSAAFNLLINHGQWPKRENRDVVQIRIVQQLLASRCSEDQLTDIFNQADGSPCPASHPEHTTNAQEYPDMLLRKQTLHPQTRKKLQMFRDPFSADDVTQPDDVFMTSSIRYVREALYQTARLGGFIAVVGESGSGKSTLRKDLITRLDQENQSVTTIEPFVLGMEDNDKTGKTLKSAQIAEAVITAIDALAKPKISAQARFRQMHQLLLESAKSGNKHCLIIEEAHGLSIPTIKHLKRFYELEHGFTKLISIVLIGQPELHHKLSERNPSVREVVQRCELVTLEPLDHNVCDYLSFKFERVGAQFNQVFSDDAAAAIERKLTMTGRDKQRHSLLYPLAINNLAVAAMNLAVELGVDNVSADVITEVN